ncbi:hypothetical protein N9E34_00370 [Opitutales bacterium]|nr:hypothetical protein [Opitutales bacterium]
MDADLYESLHDFPVHGIHNHLMKLAVYLKSCGVGAQKSVCLIKKKFQESKQSRDLQPGEVEQAVESANNELESKVATGEDDSLFPGSLLTSEESFWSWKLPPLQYKEAHFDDIKRVIDDRSFRWSIEEMQKESPIQTSSILSTEDILNYLYEPDDLISSGWTKEHDQVKPMREWAIDRFTKDVFCPNPMRCELGLKKTGDPSTRCRDNAGKRKFVVYECDHKSLTQDDQATLIYFLKSRYDLNLRLVTFSGGESLHAFFEASDDEETNRDLMSLFVKFGGDENMYRPEQKSRLPNACRLQKESPIPLIKNNQKVTQDCHYLSN